MAHSLINISAVKQQVTVAKCKPVFKVISNDGSVSEEMDLEGIKKWHSSNKQENSSSSESASSIKNTDGSTNRINQINWKDLFNLENLVQLKSTATEKQSFVEFKTQLIKIIENLEETFLDFHREFLKYFESIETFVEHFLSNVIVEKEVQPMHMAEKSHTTEPKQIASKVEIADINEKLKMNGSSANKESNNHSSKGDSIEPANEKKESVPIEKVKKTKENIKKTVNFCNKNKLIELKENKHESKNTRTSVKMSELFEVKDESPQNGKKPLPNIEDSLEDRDLKKPNAVHKKSGSGSSSMFAVTSKPLSLEKPSSKPSSPLLEISPSSSSSSSSIPSPHQASPSRTASLKPPESFKMPQPPIKRTSSTHTRNEEGFNERQSKDSYTSGTIKKRRISHVILRSEQRFASTDQKDKDWFVSDDDDEDDDKDNDNSASANDSDSKSAVEKQKKIAQMMLAHHKQMNASSSSNGTTKKRSE